VLNCKQQGIVPGELRIHTLRLNYSSITIYQCAMLWFHSTSTESWRVSEGKKGGERGRMQI